MTKKERIVELTERLNKCRNAYYNNSISLVTDSAYDKMFDELAELENEENFWLATSPIHTVGYAVVNKLNSVTHSHPMLSLGKTKDVDELIKFINKHETVLSLKMDGLTMSVCYKDGILFSAETRGNGIEGTDVLLNAYTIKNLPQKINYEKELVIDGECIITYNDFNEINERFSEDEKYAHPRNLASGSLSLLNSEETATRHLRFIPWRVISDIENVNTLSDEFQFIGGLGFDVVPHTVVSGDVSANDLTKTLENFKSLSIEMSYPCDGCVIAYNDIAYGMSLGNTSHHPRHSIAFKYHDDSVPAKLRYIDWSVGRTGVVVPTAVFTTALIDNTEVTRASVHNLSVMKELNLTNGCTVNVVKCNMIIPQIESAEEDGNGEIDIPSVCPSCGKKLIHKISDSGTEVLFCENEFCAAKLLAKFTHFVSKPAANIDGLSEATLDRLIGEEFIKTYKDIYHLEDYKDKIIFLDGFGKKSYNNLIESIEKSRNIKLENYLVALGIDNIGKTASKTISKYFNGKLHDFLDACANNFDFTTLEDFGSVMNDSIYAWVKSKNAIEEGLVDELNFIVEEEKKIDNDFINGKTFVVTGAFNTKKRSEIEKIITERGGKLAGSVSKTTNYLLTNEANSGSSKAKKAKELGTPIMTEEEFLGKI